MSKAIYVSIKTKPVEKIVNKLKNHEFRNYIPKRDFDTLYVYVTVPIKTLLYVIKINNVISYPNKIDEFGYGNKEFNDGSTTKFAYEIGLIYKLEEGITLKDLKSKYKFTPPQSYSYDETYPLLTRKIEDSNKTVL